MMKTNDSPREIPKPANLKYMVDKVMSGPGKIDYMTAASNVFTPDYYYSLNPLEKAAVKGTINKGIENVKQEFDIKFKEYSEKNNGSSFKHDGKYINQLTKAEIFNLIEKVSGTEFDLIKLRADEYLLEDAATLAKNVDYINKTKNDMTVPMKRLRSMLT